MPPKPESRFPKRRTWPAGAPAYDRGPPDTIFAGPASGPPIGPTVPISPLDLESRSPSGHDMAAFFKGAQRICSTGRAHCMFRA